MALIPRGFCLIILCRGLIPDVNALQLLILSQSKDLLITDIHLTFLGELAKPVTCQLRKWTQLTKLMLSSNIQPSKQRNVVGPGPQAVRTAALRGKHHRRTIPSALLWSNWAISGAVPAAAWERARAVDKRSLTWLEGSVRSWRARVRSYRQACLSLGAHIT